MESQEKNEADIVAELLMIRARLDSLIATLGTSGTKGIDRVLAEQETITGTIRQAIQADSRPMSLIAVLAEVNYANLTRFVKGQKNLNGATMDRLASMLGLVLVKRQ